MMCRRTLVLVTAIFVFAVAHAQAATETVIHNFNPTPHGTFPPSTLVADAAGNLYGTASGGAYNAGVLYKIAQNSQGKWTQTVLYTFKSGTDASAPRQLVIDSAGNLFGFSQTGGTGSCFVGCGAAVKFTQNAHGIWSETILFNFPKTSDDMIPTGLIAMDQAGNLYGVTDSGGDQSSEAVFELSRSTGGNWTETVLHSFAGGSDGSYVSGLIVDPLGNLFGTTDTGGVDTSCQCGTVFELSPSSGGSWTYSALYSFQGGTSDGSQPISVVMDSSGSLFGTTNLGGNGVGCSDLAGCGTVFELQPGSNGQWSEGILYSFGPSQLFLTPSPLVIDSAHNMYGTTFYGGTGGCYLGCGTVFELSPNGNGQWSETTLYNFQGGTDGYSPNFGLTLVGATLYGTTSLGGQSVISGTIFSVSLQQGKWRLRSLYSFPFVDGNTPYTGLVSDSSGNLYGTSSVGGASDMGSVYEMSPKTGGGWSEHVIYSFDLGFWTGIGAGPSALTRDTLGNLYGTTASGGTPQKGTIFEVSPSSSGRWVGTTLYTFSGGGDGWDPAVTSGLILDQSGNLYGTTHNGGANGKGTIFKLSPGSNGQWTKTILYNFAGSPLDGERPAGGLIFDDAGNLYGTTEGGGSSTNCPSGCGTVFKLSPSGSGWKETLLYSFQGSSNDGADPMASLIFDAAGNLYGTTASGGINEHCSVNGTFTSCGVVFQLVPSGNGAWTETVLHKFANSTQDGGSPVAALIFDSAGNLYGTTSSGGTYGHGTIFKLTPAGGGWTYSVAYSFGNSSDGQYPAGSLLLNSSGTFYGTTAGGGNGVNSFSNGYGTVFEFTP